MQEEKILRRATLCFPVRADDVLLAEKTEKIGAGCLNGYGGGIEAGETAIQSIIRELFEEGGVTAGPNDFELAAVVDFHNTTSDGGIFVCQVYTYLLHRWFDQFRSSKEMINPRWFKRQCLPLKQMMLADQIWVPPVLAGKKLRAQASYGPFQQTLLGEVKIEYVDTFDEAA